MKPVLLLTRPLNQSKALLRELGVEGPCVISPVMEILRTGETVDLAGYGGVIVTSANAVRHGPPLAGICVYCVGKRTSEAVERAGGVVRLVAKDADDLVARLQAHGPLLHLRGAYARGNIAERLCAAGVETREALVYRQEPRALSGEAIALIEGGGAVVLPLYSPRSAQLVGEQVSRVGPGVRAIAMSDAVADSWREASGAEAAVIPSPTAIGMRAAILAVLRR